eukprot:2851199-Alexandrium_andersonii.AAC.1
MLRQSASKRCAIPDGAHRRLAFRWRFRHALTRAGAMYGSTSRCPLAVSAGGVWMNNAREAPFE